MHVLVVPSWYPTAYQPLNGSFFQEQAEALAARGHEVGVIFPALRAVNTLGEGKLRFGLSSSTEGPLKVFREYNFNVPRLRRLQRHRSLRAFARLYSAYERSEGRPDLLHAHSAVWGGDAARTISRDTGVPYLVTEHSTGFRTGMYDGWERPHIRLALSEAAAVIAVGSALRDTLRSYADLSRVAVVPNPVHTQRFRHERDTTGRLPYRFTIIGFLHARKRVDELVRAFARTFSRDDPVELDIVGDGPDRRALVRLVDELDLTPVVRFWGAVSRSDLPAALAQADCLVSASAVETFGVTLIEGLASGIPVVATRSGGPTDIVTDSVGELVPIDSERGMDRALRRMFEEREEWRSRSELIQEYAEGRFGIDPVMRKTEAIYRDVLGRRGH